MRPSTSARKMSEHRPDNPHRPGPLAGKRILVTRSRDQAAALADLLTRLGAEPVVCPTIEIIPPADRTDLESALDKLAEVDILILSSVNAVETVFSHLRGKALAAEVLRDKQIIAVGPKTARAIEAHGVRVDLIPEDFRAEGIITLIRHSVAGKLVLYPKAGLARDLIPAGLTAAGARVLDPIAYTSSVPADSAEKLEKALDHGLDLLTFTASSTVRNFVDLISPAALAKARRIPIASIGPLTSQTARAHGLQVAVEPEASTLEAMVDAIRIYFEGLKSQ